MPTVEEILTPEWWEIHKQKALLINARCQLAALDLQPTPEAIAEWIKANAHLYPV